MTDLPQTGVVRLLTSSKGIAFLGAVVAVTTLAAMRVLDGPQVIDFLKWVLPTYMAATAAEDFAKHLATRPRAAPPSAVATVTMPPPGIIIGDSVAPPGSTLAPSSSTITPPRRGRETLDTPRDDEHPVPWDIREQTTKRENER
jgi:hypothetical protein